jgi:two-component system, NarL family, sensor histidine kinase DesK
MGGHGEAGSGTGGLEETRRLDELTPRQSAARWSAAGSPRWAHGRRRIALAAGLLAWPVVAALRVSQYSHGAAAAAGYAVVAIFVCCYLLACAALAARARPGFWALVGAMAALSAAELPFARAGAFYLLAVVVSSAALLRRLAGWVIGAGVAAAFAVPWAVRSWHSGPGWVEAPAVLLTALTVYSAFENVGAYRAMAEAQAEIARLASESERNRIARDLHDLLGHSLTAITVKSGLARRLVATGSPLAIEEITEVERLSREVLAEVRVAVSGYREVTLAGELARGRELLRASGVTADLPTATDIVAAAHQELFGWAVREGLTNVARHAQATRCTVLLSASQVEIVDDGVGCSGPRIGHGLAGLRERAAAAGGRVEAGPAVPRGWRLRVALDEAGGAAL